MDITSVKDILQEYCKRNNYKSPKYKTVFINEGDYKKLYTVSVEIKGVLTAAESGISRRIAEKKAAIKALTQLKVLNQEQIMKLNDEEKVGSTKVDKDKVFVKTPDIVKKKDDKEYDGILVNKVKTYGNNYQKITSNRVLDNRSDIRFIDENVTNNQNNIKIKPDETKTTNDKEANHKAFKIYDFEENSICALIKYCLRNQIPLPFYDFNFNDGYFCTLCKIESNGREFIGYGKSLTLRSAKMMASQEVIEQLKKCDLFYVDNKPKESKVSTCFADKFDNKFKEYSSVTINMKSNGKKIIENKSNTLPLKRDIEEFDDDFTDGNYSTFGSRDDNNNRKENSFDSITKEEWQKYHDYNIIIDNPVSYLQTYCSKLKIKSPKYEEQIRSKKEKCQFFTYRCLINKNGQLITGIGLADSKKSAKKASAEEVIKKLLKL